MKRKAHRLVDVVVVPLALLFGVPALGQWSSQSVTLRPGWNAVYLEIQPEPRECDALFAGLQVESAWRFNRKQATVQFIDDPNQLVANAPDWLTWLPPSEPLSSQSKLFILEGGQPYLIKLADNSATFTWNVHGTPVIRKPDWQADSLNFVGFPLPATSPSFQSFFTNSPGLATNRVYQVDASGIWRQLNTPSTTAMRPGEAFWIRSTGQSDYAGPLEVQLDRRAGLDFGRVLTEQTLRIRNPSTKTSHTVILRQLPSEAPPSTAYPALAGGVPLSYWQNDFSNNRVGWTNLPPQLIQSNLPPGGVWEVRLEVRRRDMASYTLPSGVSSAFYQSLLEITDTGGTTRLLIPVKADGLQNYSSTGSARLRGALASGTPLLPLHPRAGLWIGNASIKRVNQPSSANPMEPVPTGSEFQFRILVHVNESGQATFLQRVLQMWKPGQTNNASELIEPGRFVLLTDERLISSQYTGAALRDGKSVGRRFSTAAFGFREPIAMTGVGSFGEPSSVFGCPVVMPYNDPLNPLVHRYHPDHDNLDDRTDAQGNPQLLPVRTNSFGQLYTSESTTITRVVQLTFTASDPDNLALSGWGDTQLGGAYQETMTGVHKTPLVTQGTFRLQQAARVGVLNN